MVKNLPVMWETWVKSLSWNHPLEKATATHFSILAWRIPWTEEHGRLQSTGLQRVRRNRATFTFTSLLHTAVMSVVLQALQLLSSDPLLRALL